MPEQLVYEQNGVRIYHGDARSMGTLGDGSVALIVTSPPYWDIKNYRHEAQIGLGQSYADYLEQLRLVGEECHRVLAPGRFMCWVVGTRVSDGDMKHIPADCIRIFESLGFSFKKEIIWVKPKGTQGLWQRGTTQFLKTKPYPCSANINIQHEYILVLQKEGEFEPPAREPLSEEFIKRVAWSVWELPVSMTKGHPAPFPLAIPERLILLYSYRGETVLDPFLGTGTTLVAARNLGRHGIGYEISEEFCDLAETQLSSQELKLIQEV
ncbi:site-specific DNA-methyltransferase [bacterium]|nr:site-specific DNA-methyltransferase [bacterium]